MTPSELRHANVYLELAREARTDPSTLRHWLGSIERAWKFAEGDAELTLQFVWAMDDFFRLQGMGREYIDWAYRGIVAAEEIGDLRAKGILLTNIGLTLSQLGETETALPVFNEALVIHQIRRDRAEEGSVRQNIGLILLERKGDTYAAREEFDRALVLAREASDWKGEAKALSSLVAVAKNAGDVERAFALLDLTFDIYTSHKDTEGQATTLNHRGMLLWDVGRTKEAQRCYEQSLTLRTQIGDRFGIAQCLDNLGVLHFQANNYEQAVDYYTRAVEIEEATNDLPGMHATLDNMGFLYDQWDQPAKALEYYTRALSIADRMASEVHRATTLTSMALSKAAVGDVTQAMGWLEDALAIHEKTGDLVWQGATLHNMGLIARKYLSDPHRAIDLCEKALTIRRPIGAVDADSNTLRAMAMAYEDLGQWDVAERLRNDRRASERELES